jgi:hypothetical protein
MLWRAMFPTPSDLPAFPWLDDSDAVPRFAGRQETARRLHVSPDFGVVIAIPVGFIPMLDEAYASGT